MKDCDRAVIKSIFLDSFSGFWAIIDRGGVRIESETGVRHAGKVHRLESNSGAP